MQHIYTVSQKIAPLLYRSLVLQPHGWGGWSCSQDKGG